MKNFYHRAWAEINLDVLKNNIEIIREYSGNRDIIAIVKANAYGHGDAECALAMNHIAEAGAQGLAAVSVPAVVCVLVFVVVPAVAQFVVQDRKSVV